MNTQTQEALHKALKVLNCLNNNRVYETAWVKGAINACEEALAQPAQEVGDAEIKQMLDDIEYYQKRIEELEQPAQEPVAWMKSALDNARDVCKYLDHDMIKEAKAHTKFFWDDIEKIKEPDTNPAPSWQGLESEKVTQIIHGLEDKLGMPIVGAIAVARAIEQALKEKNT